MIYDSSILQYCTKVKYLDVGHNDELPSIDFVRNMPELEVLIIAMTAVTDISPLEVCPKLEYLELNSTNISDLSPLKNSTGLHHLNIAGCPNIKDISPLYGLTELERLWIGKEFSTVDTTINLSHIPVEDGGAQVMQAMACMPNLVSVDMDSCGVSNEDMAAIRDTYPDVKVIWRVWFGDAYSVRTDVERILASQPSVGGMLTRDNTEALKYCTDVKYLDIGHNEELDDISFVAYMTKLEVAILAMDYWSDATPLANCTELEYLEMQTTLCTDLTPLSGLKNLRHLNVAYIPDLEDISPLYSLTGLERLWVGCYNHVPHEQIEQMRAAAPNCEVNDTVYDDPTGGRWRYVDYNPDAYVFILHPRYIELREQFGYTKADFSFCWNDPLYY